MPLIFLLITSEEFSRGLLTSGLGLAGVFTVLIIFYICTKIMLSFSIKSNKKRAEKEAANVGN